MSPATAHAWGLAAAALARRVERRARLGHVLAASGLGLVLGAALGLGLHVLGLPGAGGLATGVGALLGAGVGLQRARQVPPVRAGDAAWALDRLAGAAEGGLYAAVAGAGPAPRVSLPPPEVRLLPPRGLALVAGGAVLAAVAWVVPADPSQDEPARAPEEAREHVAGRIAAPGLPAAGAEAARAQAEARALEAERVRRALGLSAAEGQDAATVAERLKSPEARAAAAAVAEADGPLRAALAAGEPAGADVAARLATGARAAEGLDAARRTELAHASALVAPPLPAERRALLERYESLRAAGGAR